MEPVCHWFPGLGATGPSVSSAAGGPKNPGHERKGAGANDQKGECNGAATFWAGALGIVKAVLWPALLMHQLLTYLKM
jgi:hypothetical protein